MNRDLTLAGAIVVAPAEFEHADDQITNEQEAARSEVAGRGWDRTHMQPIEWVFVILGSGTVAAGINGAFATFIARLNRRDARADRVSQQQHAVELQTLKEAHEARLRRDAAHDEARTAFLPAAESVTLYLTKLAYDAHFEEVGIFVFPATQKTMLGSPAEVMDALRSIMWGHPTKAVRDHALTLHDELVDVWYDTTVVVQSRGELTQADSSRLQKLAERLVQSIHTEASPVVASGDT